MKKVFLLTCLIAGILCTAGTIVTTIAFGFSIGNAIGLVVGAFFLALYLVHPRLSKGWAKVANALLTAGAAFVVTMILFIGIRGASNSATFDEDTVLVLGCGIRGETILPTLEKRLDKCVTYWQHNPGAVIVVSGGQGRNEAISEAEAMKRYLVARGINPEQIIKEDRSRNTKENMLLSKQLLDHYFATHGKTSYTVACITTDFHAYRASVLAERAGLPITSYNAGTAWYLRPSTYLREILSILKVWVFD